MTVYIAPIGHGLGDLIVSLPAVQWLIATGEPTWLVVRSPRQEGFAELIPGLAGAIREVDFLQSSLQPGQRYINLRQHPLQTDFIWGSPEFEQKYPDYRIADIIRDICHDFGILADFHHLQPLPFRYRNEAAAKILFIPGSSGTFKCWTANNWLQLALALAKYDKTVAVIGQPEASAEVAELIAAGLEWLPTPALKDALDVVSSAAGAVSVDTGLLHLALQQGLPVAGMWINNPGSLNYLRTVPHCLAVVSPRCQPDCVSHELDKEFNLITQWQEWAVYEPWKCRASADLRCMSNISVDTLWPQVEKMLAYAKERLQLDAISIGTG